MRLRALLVLVVVAAALAACDRLSTTPDPAAENRRACENAQTEPARRRDACSAWMDAGDLDSAQRAAAHAHRGLAAQAAGDVSYALRDFDAALDLQADNAEALEGRGRILLASGQLDAAEPMADQLIAMNQALGAANWIKGSVALQRSDFAAAVEHFNASISADGRNAMAYAGRARAKQRQDDLAGALADYDAALRIDGELGEAHAGRCWVRLTQSGKDKDNDGPARADAEAAVRLEPDRLEARLCLGILQLRARQWDEARDTFDAAARLSTGNPMALFGRGVARRRGGDGRGTHDMNQARDFDRHIGETFDDLGVATF
ncbi:tetratricopeptide repeat protein [Terricaulis sp.]|uniref:tetratricopeptide repeat protein n=1 Tax=Terricaulis sp. TaxID=2768686 RepID=UPI003783F873